MINIYDVFIGPEIKPNQKRKRHIFLTQFNDNEITVKSNF